MTKATKRITWHLCDACPDIVAYGQNAQEVFASLSRRQQHDIAAHGASAKEEDVLDTGALTNKIPPTPGWVWREVGGDFEVEGPKGEMRRLRPGSWVESLDGNKPFCFRSYLDMCWWCGGQSINPIKEERSK